MWRKFKSDSLHFVRKKKKGKMILFVFYKTNDKKKIGKKYYILWFYYILKRYRFFFVTTSKSITRIGTIFLYFSYFLYSIYIYRYPENRYNMCDSYRFILPFFVLFLYYFFSVREKKIYHIWIEVKYKSIEEGKSSKK